MLAAEAKGEKRGIEKGRIDTLRNIALTLHLQGVTLEQIATIIKLPPEQVKELLQREI